MRVCTYAILGMLDVVAGGNAAHEQSFTARSNETLTQFQREDKSTDSREPRVSILERMRISLFGSDAGLFPSSSSGHVEMVNNLERVESGFSDEQHRSVSSVFSSGFRCVSVFPNEVSSSNQWLSEWDSLPPGHCDTEYSYLSTPAAEDPVVYGSCTSVLSHQMPGSTSATSAAAAVAAECHAPLKQAYSVLEGQPPPPPPPSPPPPCRNLTARDTTTWQQQQQHHGSVESTQPTADGALQQRATTLRTHSGIKDTASLKFPVERVYSTLEDGVVSECSSCAVSMCLPLECTACLPCSSVQHPYPVLEQQQCVARECNTGEADYMCPVRDEDAARQFDAEYMCPVRDEDAARQFDAEYTCLVLQHTAAQDCDTSTGYMCPVLQDTAELDRDLPIEYMAPVREGAAALDSRDPPSQYVCPVREGIAALDRSDASHDYMCPELDTVEALDPPVTLDPAQET